MKFPRLSHEYVILWQRPRTVMSALSTLALIAKQQSSRLKGTWKAIVHNVLVALGGKATLAEIYARMARHAPERIANATHWQAKARQVLQLNPEFKQIERGTWALA